MTPPIRIGRLRQRLALDAPVDTADGAGGVTRSFTPVATVWAGVEPADTAHLFTAGANGQRVTHRILLRSGWSLTVNHRLRQGTKTYEPRSFERTADGRFVIVHAEETAP
jgi:SPP1 family predicted phage head-tail adaptor